MSPQKFSPVMQTLVLNWRLFRDKRVPMYLKLIPVASIAYYFWPIDIAPELLPALGVADDIGVVILGLNMFVNSSPAEVVRSHLIDLGFIQIEAPKSDSNNQNTDNQVGKN